MLSIKKKQIVSLLVSAIVSMVSMVLTVFFFTPSSHLSKKIYNTILLIVCATY